MFAYSIRRSHRSRYLRLSVRPDGSCVVSAPARASDSVIERFAASKEAWAMAALEKFKPFRPLRDKRQDHKAYLAHKEAARALVLARLEHFNQFYGYSWGRISIRDQKTRWGSCSHKKNLNFSYRLALLPADLADYVVVHELCHIGELNHGPNFWKLVERAVPDYAARKGALAKHSRHSVLM